MRRALTMLLVLGVLGAIAFTILFITRRGSSANVALANGIRVEFLGTAAGSASFSTEKSWERFARKHLPGRMTGWIKPASSGTCSSGSNSLTVYVRVSDPTGAPINAPPWQNYLAEDESGLRYNHEGGYCGFGGGGRQGQVYGLILRAWPRRQKDFAFLLLGSQQAVLGTLRVPNPSTGPFPNWQPESLPQARSNGPVTLTIESLKEGRATWRSLEPEWRLVASDPRWARARPRTWTLLDATGNEAQWLSPREPAWKVRTSVYRGRREDFGAREWLVLTNIAVPKPGSFVPLDRTAEVDGVRLVAHVLASAGRLSITNGVGRGLVPTGGKGHTMSASGNGAVESWGDTTPFFLVEARNAEAEVEIQFRLFDERGGEIELDKSGGYSFPRSGGGRMYERGFVPPAGAQSLTLEIIVNRPLRFEFMVNPADVQRTTP